MRAVKEICFSLLVLSCATARTVSVAPGAGGVIAIEPQDSPEAREKATSLMQSNCSGRQWKIVAEGEAVTGTKSKGSSQPMQNIFTGNKTDGTATETNTQNTTEWRLKYVCLKK